MIHLEDRSAMEADWRCGMERYWLTEYRSAGEEASPVGGIVPVQSVFDLEFGSAFADGVAALITHADSLSCADVAMMTAGVLAKWGPHIQNLGAGLVYGAGIHVYPRLQNDYDVVGAEQEHFCYYPSPAKPTLVTMTRPDLVLWHRQNKTGWVPDWKTTSWRDERWLLQWPWAIQTHIQAKGVQQARPDLNIQGSIILGAYKGYADDRTGERHSPMIWAYVGHVQDKQSWSPKYTRGWDRVSVSEYPGGIIAWVDYLKAQWPSELNAQFPTSQPVMLNDGMLEQVQQERVARLDRIQAWREKGRPMPAPEIWEHRTSNCGKCPYRTACWNVPTHLDPLAHGLYVRRVPNHELERLGWALAPVPAPLTLPPVPMV